MNKDEDKEEEVEEEKNKDDDGKNNEVGMRNKDDDENKDDDDNSDLHTGYFVNFDTQWRSSSPCYYFNGSRLSRDLERRH